MALQGSKLFYYFIEGIGGGMNVRRPRFLVLTDAGDGQTLIVAHKDRLIRFDYEWCEPFY